MAVPAMRVIVDGDSSKVYRKGDKVTGRIMLVVEEEEHIQSLKLVFGGNCITQTSRPFHVNGGESSPSRREFEEKIRLFSQEKDILPASRLRPKKYTWAFEFVFPESTTPRFARVSHGANYLKEPHPLPPTFQLRTNVPSGAAHISYFVRAKLTLGGSKRVKSCKVLLSYRPMPQIVLPRESRCTSAVLYGQTWKPARDAVEDAQGTFKNVFSKVSRRARANSTPRIIPSLLYPEIVAPGQHIPISLLLRNTRDSINEARAQCTIDSLSVTISTYSTSMCGHSLTQPEDVVSKHVTCIAKTAMNKTAQFGVTSSLTSNFRLVDDGECVPTFKTYTITRRYSLGISIGIKYEGQSFVIRSNTPLEIVSRVPRDLLPPAGVEADDFDPLPLYAPREPSKEFAPDYESIFAVSKTISGSNSLALAPTYSRSSSYVSNVSGSSETSSGASTPASEIEQPVFEPITSSGGVRTC
ncbi:hypothetical protein BDU57DRAFT_261729 [Ampelomyces quisqualis]|uniref:Arrestin-like N-terminal domain-containing protein n=1 Tax=Ampelomyces quisqualis TaxID=50730 RepID=A0A6A5QK49_AMPQU|nr:hypothetical protein BDU57DRAFT_261729 [Ampelomyces quisqualis]